MLARTRDVEAERGTIFSSDGFILAQSKPEYDFWVFYDRTPCTPGFFMALAEAAGVPEARISAPFHEGKKRTWLEPLDADHYRAVRSVTAEWGADGVSLDEAQARAYPMGDSAVGVVGWMSEGAAKSGVEAFYDAQLSGTGGRSVGVVGLNGRFSGDPSGVHHGLDIVLTVDSKLQEAATTAVREAVEQNRASSGAAIVLVPATGDVLAMANWPAFDPASGPQGGTEMMASYMEDLQPGSTMKVLTLAKALDMGVVDDSFSLTCTGQYDLGHQRWVKCDLHHGNRAHGTVDLEKAIAKSCNISAATWALKIGRDPMIAYMRDLGLLSKPSLGLTGIAAPLFDMNEWDKERQLAVLGFGQSVAVPPVSLAAALAMLANGGEYVAPRLVSQIGGQRVAPIEPKRIVSPLAAQRVMRLMESVVQKEMGTGYALRIPGYRIAGKTGTAQKLGSGGGHVSSFVGMFPAEKPQALVLVMINDAKAGDIYGSLVAGPAFDEIAKAVIARLQIPSSSGPAKTSNKVE